LGYLAIVEGAITLTEVRGKEVRQNMSAKGDFRENDERNDKLGKPGKKRGRTHR
jgi:hypothetical protein